MLTLEVKLTPRQFNMLLALYFEQWEPTGVYHKSDGKPVESYRLKMINTENNWITMENALTRHGLVQRVDSGQFVRITEKGKKVCEAVCLEIEDWSRRIAKLRKSKKTA